MSDVPGLLQVARNKMRTRHLAYRTEQTYCSGYDVTCCFISGSIPGDLGAPGVEQFLTHLAVHRKVLAKGAKGVRSPLDRGG